MDGPATRPDRDTPVIVDARGVPTDRDSSGPRIAYRATIQTEHRHHASQGLVAVVLVLAILIVKPWGEAPAGLPTPAEPRSSVAVRTPSSPTPTATPSRAGSEVAGICIDVGAWLLASIELDRAQTIRVWRAIGQATSATGPLDPTIPLAQIRSDGVLGLGWCGPKDGPDAATEQADVQAWRIDGRTATPIPLVATQGTVSSGFGALYRPIDPAATSWAPAVYVFRHVTSDGREHWFRLRLLAKARAGSS